MFAPLAFCGFVRFIDRPFIRCAEWERKRSPMNDTFRHGMPIACILCQYYLSVSVGIKGGQQPPTPHRLGHPPKRKLDKRHEPSNPDLY